jgi:Na+/pantothenate symporter
MTHRRVMAVTMVIATVSIAVLSYAAHSNGSMSLSLPPSLSSVRLLQRRPMLQVLRRVVAGMRQARVLVSKESV